MNKTLDKIVDGELNGKKTKAVKAPGGCTLFMPNDDIEETLYSSWAEVLNTGKVSNNSFLGKLVQQSAQRISIQAGKDAGTAMFAVRTINDIANKTAQYYNKKKTTDTDFSKYLLRDKLFDYQKEVYDDTSKKKTMLWGRRAGKTHTAIRLALKAILEKDVKQREVIIIGLTLEKTAGLYWDELKKAVEDTHIPTSHIDNGTYKIEFSNRNVIQLWGNNSKAEREKIRGRDSYMFIIDEMQSQQGLYYLLTDVIGPIIRGRDGEIVCLGTAPISAGTKWEEILNDDSWSHSHATMENNPTIPDYQHALENVLNDNHWTKDNITFRREYLGEIAYDTERMILPKRTYYKDIPDDFKPVKCYIGVDYGWRDFSSFAPILIDAHGNAYLFGEWKQNKTSASELVNVAKSKVDVIHKKWNIPIEDIHIVADSSHQQISVDFYNQGITQVENAYKQDENYQWARLAEALEIGDLKIKESEAFDRECDALVWQWNSEKGCIIYKIDEDVFHPDISDSVKYAYNQYLSDRNMG